MTVDIGQTIENQNIVEVLKEAIFHLARIQSEKVTELGSRLSLIHQLSGTPWIPKTFRELKNNDSRLYESLLSDLNKTVVEYRYQI